jgi:hypothetical protein
MHGYQLFKSVFDIHLRLHPATHRLCACGFAVARVRYLQRPADAELARAAADLAAIGWLAIIRR